MTKIQNTILIVDDNPANIVVLGKLLEKNYTIVVANNGKKAIEIARQKPPDMILLDIMMPEMDGFEVCSILKSHPKTAAIPVIFITALSEKEDIIKGFEVGGQDYITKPFNAQELYLRIETHLEIINSHKRLQEYSEELKEKNVELSDMMKKLDKLVRLDTLTELANRRCMMERLNEEAARSSRTGKPFAIAIVDIDDFKSVNDNYGHDCGDKVLISFASILKDNVRRADTASRWGGEEFLILFPETNINAAEMACEKIRKKIADTVIDYPEEQIKLKVTATFGVSDYRNSSSINEMLIAADKALYQGKTSSKNCVTLAGRG